MAYPFPPDVQQLIRLGMAIGNYATEDDILREALNALSNGTKIWLRFKRASQI